MKSKLLHSCQPFILFIILSGDREINRHLCSFAFIPTSFPPLYVFPIRLGMKLNWNDSHFFFNMSGYFVLLFRGCQLPSSLSLLINVHVLFPDDFQIFARSGISTHFVLLFKTVATQVPTMCMLVDQKFPPDLRKIILGFSFIIPIVHLVSNLPFCSMMKIPGSHACVSSSCTTSHFISSMQSERRGSKTASLALSAHQCFFSLLNSIPPPPNYFFFFFLLPLL